MPPDPQMQAVLDQLARLDPAPLESLTPPAARRRPTPADAVRRLLVERGEDPAPQSIDRVEELTIPGPAGEIVARLYAPESPQVLPVVVYWHGGGWVLADIDTYDATPRALANAARCIIVSCHYRQAPEHPFPDAVEDAYAAYGWVRAHAADLGGDAGRVAVAGESAGANLATVVSMLARDRAEAPPAFQLLVYPVTDFGFATPSMRQYEHAPPLDTDMMRWFWGHYLARDTDGVNPYASPLRAASLAGMPATMVVVAEIDPLRSEGEQYAERLAHDGVEVQIERFDGVTHEFFGMTAVLEAAREAVTRAAMALRRVFGEIGGPDELSQAPVETGMDVVSLDGHPIGTVKVVRQGDFLVDRRRRRDLYVPLWSVAEVADGQVRLHTDVDDISDRDWTKPLAVRSQTP